MSITRIILSRTDSIGDVILTLPMAGALKEAYPNCELVFLGRDYTREVVALSSFVDEFVSWDDTNQLSSDEKIRWLKNLNAETIIHVFPQPEIAVLAKKAGIPIRIGASGRVYHYRNCNKIVPLSRRRSNLHEAQLNFKLLKPLIHHIKIPTHDQLDHYYGFRLKSDPDTKITSLIDKDKFNLILHPKSKGSAREWPVDRFSELIEMLPAEKFRIFITGTIEDGKMLESFISKNNSKITDLTGHFSLKEFIAFINQCDGLVAASTGPLHIAAALGKLAVGIYPPIKPMHPGRWAPIGKNAHYVTVHQKCNDCRKSLNCHCMNKVSPEAVMSIIMKNG